MKSTKKYEESPAIVRGGVNSSVEAASLSPASKWWPRTDVGNSADLAGRNERRGIVDDTFSQSPQTPFFMAITLTEIILRESRGFLFVPDCDLGLTETNAALSVYYNSSDALPSSSILVRSKRSRTDNWASSGHSHLPRVAIKPKMGIDPYLR